MRVALQQRCHLAVFSQPHIQQRGDNALAPLRFGQRGFVNFQAFADDGLDGQARRQRRQRILKHHLYFAPQRAARGGISTLPARAADADFALGRHQIQHRQRQRGLAGAGFADHAQRLAGCQLKIYAAHCRKPALFEPTLDAGQTLRVIHFNLFGGDRAAHAGRGHHALRAAIEQLFRVSVLRRARDFAGDALLHNHAALHHRHAVRKAPHQIQIMRNQQQRHAGLCT